MERPLIEKKRLRAEVISEIAVPFLPFQEGGDKVVTVGSLKSVTSTTVVRSFSLRWRTVNVCIEGRVACGWGRVMRLLWGEKVSRGGCSVLEVVVEWFLAPETHG